MTGYGCPWWMRVALQVLAWFQLVSAVGGAVALASGAMEQFGMPRSMLEGSVFPDFVWPGIILGVVVGGTQLLPLLAQYLRFELAWGLHAVGGFAMMIWIFVETGIIQGVSFLQVLYFSTGLVQCVLVMLVLGVWPRPFGARAERAGGGRGEQESGKALPG